MKAFKLLIPAMFILFSIPSAYSQNIEYLGSTLWSGVCDVKIQGQYAYCAFFNGLMILDVSDSTSPSFVGQYYIGGDWDEFRRREGQKLAISGNYVYFAADYEGLNIIDVSDPSNPILASQYLTPSYATDVFVDDTLAYVTCQSASLEILNIADAQNPILLGHCGILSNPRGVWVRGNYAYLADDLGGLVTVDVSNPVNPSVVGSLIINDFALDIMVIDTLAYIADGWGGLAITNISNPVNPTFIGRWSNPGNVWVDGLYVSGHYAYLATDEGLWIIDVSEPATPIYLGNLNRGWELDVFVVGNIAYAAALTFGIEAIDVTDPANARLIGEYSLPAGVIDLSVSGNYVYTACGVSGIKIVDIINPTNPMTVGGCLMPDPIYVFTAAQCIDVSGEYAYVCTHFGLKVVDIRNPENPEIVGNYDIEGGGVDIAIKDTLAYIADDGAGLVILNIGDPSHPSPISSFPTPYPYRVKGVYISGDYAHLSETSKLQIVNISDPANPVLVSNINTASATSCVSGNYAYLGGNYTLSIYDISDPSAPMFKSSLTLPANPEGIFIRGNLALISGRWPLQGLQIVDITDKSNPIMIEEYRTAGDALDVIANGDDQILLADDYSFMILQYDMTGIDDDRPIPKEFSLSQNYPNPFNAQTTISYSLSKSGPVKLSIYNLLGQKVATLIDGIQEAGEHDVTWDASKFTSGVYFARLESEDQSKNIKMVLLK